MSTPALTCSSKRPLRVAMIAGEASGDILGAGLMQGLQALYPNIEFYGIGGPLMLSHGFDSKVPMERLSVMGLFEVLSRLCELVKLRRSLVAGFKRNPPDVFIGIDAPDFNLSIEKSLKDVGVPTVHYVSPSVWAWKKQRIYKIKKAVDLLLCLFPFERQYYRETQQRIAYVGHPLAKVINAESNSLQNRQQLGLSETAKIVALLPGSRSSEIKYLLGTFLATAQHLSQENDQLSFVIAAANQHRYDEIAEQLTQYPSLPITLVLEHSREVMAAADAILIASGTATLEAALIGKPMVVAYKMASLTYAIYSRMLHTKYVSLPNILAGKALVPELLQDNANVENLARQLKNILNDESHRANLANEYQQLHRTLNVDSNMLAAKAIQQLLNTSPVTADSNR